MRPYYEDSHVTIYHGDCQEILPYLDPVETCITDPPYGLNFMGQDWDHDVPGEKYWSLVRETVKPGGMLLAFGGTRLWHWLAVGIEQAGWEIRDTLMYMYGTGFPKSHDISKAIDRDAGAERVVVGENPNHRGESQYSNRFTEKLGQDGRVTAPATDAAKTWDGWGTAMKPSYEPIILAMNPTDGTFAENALEHGVAGLNVDGARIETGDEKLDAPQSDPGNRKGVVGRAMQANSDAERNAEAQAASIERTNRLGRWPANVVLDEDAAEMLDEQSGQRKSAYPGQQDLADHYEGTSVQGDGPTYLSDKDAGRSFSDSGGASRFFYTAKASRSDRGPGNDHPTVKPSDLMKWLCTLTKTPDGGTVLDPFMGSGTTLLAAKETGRKAVGIETNEEYCEIAARRCAQGVLDL